MLVRCMRTVQIMLITVVLVTKNAVLQGYPIRELYSSPPSCVMQPVSHIRKL